MHGGTQTPPPSGRHAEQSPVQIETPHMGAPARERSSTGCDMSVETPGDVVSSPQPASGERRHEKQSAYQSYLR